MLITETTSKIMMAAASVVVMAEGIIFLTENLFLS